MQLYRPDSSLWTKQGCTRPGSSEQSQKSFNLDLDSQRHESQSPDRCYSGTKGCHGINIGQVTATMPREPHHDNRLTLFVTSNERRNFPCVSIVCRLRQACRRCLRQSRILVFHAGTCLLIRPRLKKKYGESLPAGSIRVATTVNTGNRTKLGWHLRPESKKDLRPSKTNGMAASHPQLGRPQTIVPVLVLVEFLLADRHFQGVRSRMAFVAARCGRQDEAILCHVHQPTACSTSCPALVVNLERLFIELVSHFRVTW